MVKAGWKFDHGKYKPSGLDIQIETRHFLQGDSIKSRASLSGVTWRSGSL